MDILKLKKLMCSRQISCYGISTFQVKTESVEKVVNGKANSPSESFAASEKTDAKPLESKESLDMQTNIPSNLNE